MERVVFTMDGNADAYVGYTSGANWNGWACPNFEVNEAFRIMEEFNKCAETPMHYDEATDSFRVDYEVYKGINCKTAEGIKHLYPIGSHCWVWDQTYTTELAKEIEDFLWEFDTYEYWNNLKGSEDIAEEIDKQLQDVDVFREAIIIFRNEDLSADEKFEQLRKELMI